MSEDHSFDENNHAKQLFMRIVSFLCAWLTYYQCNFLKAIVIQVQVNTTQRCNRYLRGKDYEPHIFVFVRSLINFVRATEQILSLG